MAIIISTIGIQTITQEFRRNLHLIIACLRSHLKVNQKLAKDKAMLFITASHAEQFLNTI